MTLITPGIDFLLRGGFSYILPSAFFAIALNYVSQSNNIPIPTFVHVLIGVFATPAYGLARVYTSEWKARREARRLGARLIPRVKGASVGNLDVLRKLMRNSEDGYPGDGSASLIKEYGPIVDMHFLWDYAVITVCPEHIKAMLAKDFNNFEKGQDFRANMDSVLGTGVFNSDGDMWKFHRSMTRPFFSRDRISHFDLFDRHAEIVIQKMRERSRQGLAIDFQDLMGRFTLDSATDFLFGSCVHSLNGHLPFPHTANHIPYTPNSDPSDEVAENFAHAFLHAQRIISSRQLLGWVWPLTEIWGDKTKEPMKVVKSFIAPIVDDAVRKKRSADEEKATLGTANQRNEDIGDNETLLDHLVNFTSDPVVLRDEVLNILIAGRDTTTATLTVIVYFLSTHPAIFTRLRNEVAEKVGTDKRPTFENIREMKFLRAVINETLRLYPIVPFNVRTSIQPTVWPSPDPNEKPLYIPAKTKVSYSVMLMQRRKDLWGPDAEEFDPDRFLDARLNKYLIPNSFAFLPFNAGPRICLGQQFAYNEMSFMLPHTKPNPAWKNDVGTRKGMEKFFPKVSLTLYAHGGLLVCLLVVCKIMIRLHSRLNSAMFNLHSSSNGYMPLSCLSPNPMPSIHSRQSPSTPRCVTVFRGLLNVVIWPTLH
ncbi:cytochrome P450 family protein [Pleurotus pulmonarius]